MDTSDDRARRLPFQVVAGIAVSAFFLWIAFRNVPFSDVVASLRTANYWWLLAYPVLGITLNLIRGEIWRRLLGKRAATIDAFWAYSIGFLVNNVLPFRMGEAARIVALSEKRRLPVLEVAAAAALERIFDLAAILVVVVSVLPFVTHSVDVNRAAVWSAAAVTVMLIGLAVLIVGRRRADRIIQYLGIRIVPRSAEVIRARWHELSNGLAVVGDLRVALPVGAGMATVWMLTIMLQWTVLRAFQPAAGLVDAAVMVAVVSIGGAIPAAPGAVGTYQWVGQQSLAIPFPTLYSPATALAVAVVSHAASYIFSTVLGAIGVWNLGIPLAQIRRSARAENTVALEQA